MQVVHTVLATMLFVLLTGCAVQRVPNPAAHLGRTTSDAIELRGVRIVWSQLPALSAYATELEAFGRGRDLRPAQVAEAASLLGSAFDAGADRFQQSLDTALQIVYRGPVELSDLAATERLRKIVNDYALSYEVLPRQIEDRYKANIRSPAAATVFPHEVLSALRPLADRAARLRGMDAALFNVHRVYADQKRAEHLAQQAQVAAKEREANEAKFDLVKRTSKQCGGRDRVSADDGPSEFDMCAAVLREYDAAARGAEAGLKFFDFLPHFLRPSRETFGTLLVSLSNFTKEGRCVRSRDPETQNHFLCSYSTGFTYADSRFVGGVQAATGNYEVKSRRELFRKSQSGEWRISRL